MSMFVASFGIYCAILLNSNQRETQMLRICAEFSAAIEVPF